MALFHNSTLPNIAQSMLVDPSPMGNVTAMGMTERAVWMYVSLFILIPGVVGNILTILLMTRCKFRQCTTSWYLIVLAVSDTGVLLSGLLRRWLSATFDFDWRALNTISCRTGVFLTYVCCHISAWTVVAVTMERLIVVLIPHKFPTLATTRNVAIILSVILALSVCLDNHFLWSFDFHTYELRGRLIQHCEVITKYRHFYYHIWSWFDLCAYSLFPFCFLLVGNVCILVRLARLKVRTNQVKSVGRGILAEPWMTTVLLCLSFSFIITTLPQPVAFIIYFSRDSERETEASYRTWRVTYAILNELVYLNHAIHFPLYCVSGSRFRHELMLMFGKERCCTKHSKEGNNHRTNNHELT